MFFFETRHENKSRNRFYSIQLSQYSQFSYKYHPIVNTIFMQQPLVPHAYNVLNRVKNCMSYKV